MSYEFASTLAGCGITIVSGAAYGVDAAAHLGALLCAWGNNCSLGLRGYVPYPASHKQLLDKIAEQGIVLSEYPMELAPSHFVSPCEIALLADCPRRCWWLRQLVNLAL